MEVRIYSNLSRPGVGLKPKSEGQRPLLPQHARHCPVLEAGSALGFLAHPPLNPDEAYYVEYRGDGCYEFRYFVRNPAGAWGPVFSVTWTLPMGSIGMMREEVALASPWAESDIRPRRLEMLWIEPAAWPSSPDCWSSGPITKIGARPTATSAWCRLRPTARIPPAR